VQISADDLEDLRAWPQVVEFFRNHVVDLSLSGPVDAQCLLDQTQSVGGSVAPWRSTRRTELAGPCIFGVTAHCYRTLRINHLVYGAVPPRSIL
jgi:hypothetical protein